MLGIANALADNGHVSVLRVQVASGQTNVEAISKESPTCFNSQRRHRAYHTAEVDLALYRVTVNRVKHSYGANSFDL